MLRKLAHQEPSDCAGGGSSSLICRLT
jgi:hypothetical protein